MDASLKLEEMKNLPGPDIVRVGDFLDYMGGGYEHS
jgi:hypothetical protein